MVRVALIGQLWPLGMLLLCCFILLAVLQLQTARSAHPPLLHATSSKYDHLESLEDLNIDLNYGIVVDAGSTGSRLFLYCWPAHTGNERDLIDIRPVLDQAKLPVVKKVSPGLSTFAEYPQNASEYIRPLLDYAAENVPKEKRAATQVFILATAGMRLVPQAQQDAILVNLRTNLPKLFNFQILPEHIQVISGKWEGVYSWIAVNYILGRFKHDKEPLPAGQNRSKTVGMIDMGGASMQIAFEFTGSLGPNSEDLVQVVNLGCSDHDTTHSYQLFVTTFLGFGVNEAQKMYEQALSDRLFDANETTQRDPCLPVNLVKTVQRDDGTSFSRKGIGDWKQCYEAVSKLLRKDECSLPPCFFANVRRPASADLSAADLFGFSEYWYSLQDVLTLGGPYNYEKTSTMAHEFCHLRWSTIQERARKQLYPLATDERLRSQCFKSAWISAVLHEGFGVSRTVHNFKTAFRIAGQEVQWALGAMLYNMRYFPLGDIQRKELERKRGREQYGHIAGGDSTDATTSSLGLYHLLLVASAIVLIALVARCYLISSRRSTSCFG
uniref:Ectonucleoside triphosphate diphosphohydrolase 7 n=2 Tax=Plectus sambesii TaxID=2011161 RepID=A0A914XHY7_9BILA